MLCLLCGRNLKKPSLSSRAAGERGGSEGSMQNLGTFVLGWFYTAPGKIILYIYILISILNIGKHLHFRNSEKKTPSLHKFVVNLWCKVRRYIFNQPPFERSGAIRFEKHPGSHLGFAEGCVETQQPTESWHV